MQLKQNEIDAIVSTIVSKENETYTAKLLEAKKNKVNVSKAKKWVKSLSEIPKQFRGNSNYNVEMILNSLADEQCKKFRCNNSAIRDKVTVSMLVSKDIKELYSKLKIQI